MLVVDSCVLIHLCMYKDASVYKETVIEGKRGKSQIAEAFKKWLIKKDVDSSIASEVAQKEGIEMADATVILLTEKVNGMLLTNDKALILVARSRGIPCLWMTSFLLKLCKDGKIKKEEALDILYELVQSGLNIEAKIYAILEKKLRME